MTRAPRWGLFLASTLLAAGCSESLVPLGGAHDLDVFVPHAIADGSRRTLAAAQRPSLSSVTNEGSQDAPPGTPSEYQVATELSVVADAGFTPDSNAYGQALLNYTATNVDAAVDLTLTGSVNGQNHGEEERSYLLPLSREVSAQTRVATGGKLCGVTAQSTAKGTIWNSALINASWLSWGRKTSTDTHSALQAPCTESGDPPSPGTMWYVCLTYDVYAADGTYLYSYDGGCWWQYVPYAT